MLHFLGIALMFSQVGSLYKFQYPTRGYFNKHPDNFFFFNVFNSTLLHKVFFVINSNSKMFIIMPSQC